MLWNMCKYKEIFDLALEMIMLLHAQMES
jgi:hypothetical protein